MLYEDCWIKLVKEPEFTLQNVLLIRSDRTPDAGWKRGFSYCELILYGNGLRTQHATANGLVVIIATLIGSVNLLCCIVWLPIKICYKSLLLIELGLVDFLAVHGCQCSDDIIRLNPALKG